MVVGHLDLGGRMAERQSLTADLIDGAVAVLVATWVMGKVTSALYERENEPAREREDEARGGKTAYGVAAEKTARLAGAEHSQKQRKQVGQAIH